MARTSVQALDSSWGALHRVGGAAALAAGVIFRRNLAAEISLLGTRAPVSVVDWFALLQGNRLLGLTLLNAFDIVDYALVGLMFLALCAALRRAHRGMLAIAAVSGLAGITVYFASNTAFTVLYLSDQYAAATADAQRSMLLAAGQAALAANQGAGTYVSLFLLAISGLLFSVAMLRSGLFAPGTAYLGILGAAFDLVYCVALPFVPAAGRDSIALGTIPAAGLFLMVWHILVGVRLLQLARLEGKALP